VAAAVDPGQVKGLDKLTSVRLAEVMTQMGTIPSEVITDALYAQDKHGEPFVQILVAGSHITEWDLAKLVTENFQLPFLMASSYQINEVARDRLPKEVLFRHLLVPIDAFQDIVCVAMPILTPFEVLMKIQKDHGCDLFPYVGLVSENKKVLGELFKDYGAWAEAEHRRREEEATRKASSRDKAKAGDWMSIFDAGDQAIRGVPAGKKGAPSAPAGGHAGPAPAKPPRPAK
jgi:hypothetical protein